MIGIIITLIAVGLVAFFGLRLLKSIIIFKVLFKVISLGFAILFVILVISSYYIIKDANDFRKNFVNEKNLFVLSSDEVISAFELNNKTYSEVEDLEYVSESLDKYEFSNIDDDYYKIFLIKTDTLDYINTVELKEMDTELTGQELKKILESPEPKTEMKNIVDDDRIANGIDNMGISDAELKNYLFSYVITELFNPKNINIFLSNIKADNIVVYEDTAFFKSIQFVPNVLIKDLSKTGNATIFTEKENSTQEN